MVKAADPDAIIVATGSTYIHPTIPGVDGPNVKTVKDVEHHTVPVGQNVVICGGGIVGSGMRHYVGHGGKERHCGRHDPR